MSDFKPGLEGVIAFETEIAEPDREGGALRYRGVDIEDLVGQVSYGHVWGLLVDNAFTPGLPPAEPYPIPVRSGDIRVDVQSALAMLAPAKGMRPLLDISDEQARLDISDEQARDDLARASVMTLSFVAQSARGTALPAIPQEQVERSSNIVERFMIRWRGEPDPRHVKAVDAYWTSAAEHGMNASTFTARVIASTGADVAAALSGAVGAMSGPLHGGAPARVLHMVEEVERIGDATRYVKAELDKGERLMGFGHRGEVQHDGRPVLHVGGQHPVRPAGVQFGERRLLQRHRHLVPGGAPGAEEHRPADQAERPLRGPEGPPGQRGPRRRGRPRRNLSGHCPG